MGINFETQTKNTYTHNSGYSKSLNESKKASATQPIPMCKVADVDTLYAPVIDTVIDIPDVDTLYAPVIDTVYESKEAEERVNRVKKESQQIVLKMNDAIKGLGTDNKLFEEALNEIDEDNIVEVIKLWNSTAGLEYGETFIESFFDDANTKQRQVYGKKLIEALDKRMELQHRKIKDDEEVISEFNKLNSAKLFPKTEKMAALFDRLYMSTYGSLWENPQMREFFNIK